MKMGKKLNIFSKKTVVKQLDEIKDSINDGSKLSRLERFNARASIFGVIATVILSFWALLLTYRYGESRDQVNELSKISKTQNEELSRLLEMVEGLKRQNEIANGQYKELKIQGTTLAEQSLILNQQLGVGQKQQLQFLKLEDQKYNLITIEFSNKFSKLLPIFSYDGIGKFKNSGKICSRDTIAKIKDLLEELATNTLFLENNYLTNSYQIIRDMLTTSLMEPKSVIKAVAGGKYSSSNQEENWNNLLIDKLFELYLDVFDYIKKIKRNK